MRVPSPPGSLRGAEVAAPDGKDQQNVVLHQEQTPTPAGMVIEQTVFSMTLSTKTWRLVRRKRTVPLAPK